MTECSAERVATRQDLLRVVPRAGRVAELGVFAGDFAADILRICDPLELHLVDRWIGQIECGDQDGKNVVKRDGEELYAEVRTRFKDKPRVHLHQANTTELNYWPIAYLDFVYIDADHDEEAVTEDLYRCNRVIKPGGLIAGHDYTAAFPGVIRAVDTFCDIYGWQVAMLTQDGCPSYLLRSQYGA